MKFYSGLLALVFCASAAANQTLDVMAVGAPKGGSTNRMWDIKTKHFQEAGYNLKIDYSGPTCNFGLLSWNNVGRNQKALAQMTVGSLCLDSDFKPEELVGIDFGVTYNLCTAKNKSRPLTLDDFLDAKKEKKVALSFASTGNWRHYINAMGLKDSVRFIPYESSGALHTAFLSTDIDYVVTFNDWAIRNSDKVNCLLLAADERSEHWPGAKLVRDVVPAGTGWTNHTLIFYTMARGFTPDEMAQLRKIHNQIKSSPEWQQQIMSKGNASYQLPLEAQAQIVRQGFNAQKQLLGK